MTDTQDDISLMTCEQKVTRLYEILTRLDNSATPIDKLAEDVKIGARLIKEFDTKLKQVETEVRDAFEELDYKENPLDSNTISPGSRTYSYAGHSGAGSLRGWRV